MSEPSASATTAARDTAPWWARAIAWLLTAIRGRGPIAEPRKSLAPSVCSECGVLYLPRPSHSAYERLPVCRTCNGEQPLSEAMYLARVVERARAEQERNDRPAGKRDARVLRLRKGVDGG